jgi:HAD superfamily hydrolase (TIGR01509 family)
MAIKGLIFDMDGTLTNSQGFWRELRRIICEHCGVAVEGEVVELVKWDTPWEELRKYLWANCGLFGTVAEFWDFAHGLVCNFYRDEVETMPNVVEFLKEMKARGYLLGVATATARGPAGVALESTGILPLLDARVSVDEVGVGKTKPDVYLECARRMGGLQKDEVVVFEDALYCVETLHSNGFTVVGVHEPSIPEEEWAKVAALANRTIEDYRELL